MSAAAPRWAAGQRASCAALATAYLERPRVEGSVVVAFVVESHLGHRGLLTVGNQRGPFAESILLDYPLTGGMRRNLSEQLGAVGGVDERSLPTRYSTWQVETVDLALVERLKDDILDWLTGEER